MPTAITPTTMYSATFVPFRLQLVSSANVQQAQAEYHERDAVEDDVAHWSFAPQRGRPIMSRPHSAAGDE